MVQIVNGSLQTFLKDIQDKSLIFFGAGRKAHYVYEDYGIKKKIEAVIDNNIGSLGEYFEYRNGQTPIVSMGYLVDYIKKNGIDKVVMLITPVYSAISIIEQLDAITELENMRCYIAGLLDDYYEKKPFEFSNGSEKIPAKIHYCWFGKKEIPSYLQKYMDTWKRQCPDYEIIRWDENNYDVTKNPYMKEAYESEKWGFVPDYARLDIIYHEGGIYLDTDVEVLQPLDCLRRDDAFFCFNAYGQVNAGVGFGSVENNEFIKTLRDVYDNLHFYREDKTINDTTCVRYQTPVFKEYGFRPDNEYQKINNIVIYPSEVLAPTGVMGFANRFSEKTISNHHTEGTWLSGNAKEQFERGRRDFSKRLNLV